MLHGNDVLSISNLVGAYNLTSLETIIPLGGFDQDWACPPLGTRFSNEKDEFKGIGMDKPTKLMKKVLLVADKNRFCAFIPTETLTQQESPKEHVTC